MTVEEKDFTESDTLGHDIMPDARGAAIGTAIQAALAAAGPGVDIQTVVSEALGIDPSANNAGNPDELLKAASMTGRTSKVSSAKAGAAEKKKAKARAKKKAAKRSKR